MPSFLQSWRASWSRNAEWAHIMGLETGYSGVDFRVEKNWKISWLASNPFLMGMSKSIIMRE
jgi:hypothetical protein